jgi:hypothetical protein
VIACKPRLISLRSFGLLKLMMTRCGTNGSELQEYFGCVTQITAESKDRTYQRGVWPQTR